MSVHYIPYWLSGLIFVPFLCYGNFNAKNQRLFSTMNLKQEKSVL